MTEYLGFNFRAMKNGEVKISHHGKPVTVLRSDTARAFLQDMANADLAAQQQEMARLTGNYKRGNERLARNHPRNR